MSQPHRNQARERFRGAIQFAVTPKKEGVKSVRKMDEHKSLCVYLHKEEPRVGEVGYLGRADRRDNPARGERFVLNEKVTSAVGAVKYRQNRRS